jgi:hypothetical protein
MEKKRRNKLSRRRDRYKRWWSWEKKGEQNSVGMMHVGKVPKTSKTQKILT